MKVLLFAAALFCGQTYAFTEIAASSLTCAQVTANVEAEGRYYLQTERDGIIPIFINMPVSKNPSCSGRSRVAYELVMTSDQPDCHVGYNCVNN